MKNKSIPTIGEIRYIKEGQIFPIGMSKEKVFELEEKIKELEDRIFHIEMQLENINSEQ